MQVTVVRHSPVYRCEKITAQPNLEALFRRYRTGAGRRFTVRLHNRPLSCTDTYWDGGSRSQYTFVRLSDHKVFNLPDLISGGFSRYASVALEAYRAIPMPPGVVCLETGTFCGKDKGLTIIMRPEDAPTYGLAEYVLAGEYTEYPAGMGTADAAFAFGSRVSGSLAEAR